LETKSRKSRRTALFYSTGLRYLNKYVEQNYKSKNVESILPVLKKGNEDVYRLLNSFVTYLQNDTSNGQELTPRTISGYIAIARSYFLYNDIEILPTKVRNKISMPTIGHEDQVPIDANEIKEILQHCTNRRLRAYILTLASGGMRATEALGIRLCDLDFSGIDFADTHDRSEPATVRIRKEFSETRRERRIFISNEAARYLKEWINYTYRDKTPEQKRRPLINRKNTRRPCICKQTA
jgi:integrase